MKEVPVSIEFTPITEKTIIFDYDAPFDRKGIVKRILKQKQTFVIYLHTGWPPEGIPERIMRSGISSSWFIALDCFGVQQYPATILFASIAVEVLLNRDSRMFKYRADGKKWLHLADALEKGRMEGIDTSDLMDDDGTFTTFLQRRNKMAHGDLVGYTDFLQQKGPQEKLSEMVMVTASHALDQLSRSFNFIKKWAESKPIFMMDEKD